MANEPASGANESAPDATGCPLPWSVQRKNLLVFAGCKALLYLAAPVTYAGVYPPLFKLLGASDLVANLPKQIQLAGFAAPLLVAWLCPWSSWLKRNLMFCFLANALAIAGMAAALFAGASAETTLLVALAQIAVSGATLPTAEVLLWELIARGVDESRRGLTLALAFGGGPVMAALSSLGADYLLNGKVKALPWIQATSVVFPENYLRVFSVAAPAMALCLLLVRFVVVPKDEGSPKESIHEDFLAGLKHFARDKTLRLAAVVTFLLYVGNLIDSTMNLYTPYVLGVQQGAEAPVDGGPSNAPVDGAPANAANASNATAVRELPTEYVGLQMFIRFATKAVAGVILGWLVARLNVKAGLLATAALFTVGVLWAMFASGPAYLAAFAFFGAGELIGVYAPNYILSASRAVDYRRNMAVATLILAAVTPVGSIYGRITDYGQHSGDPVFGYRLAFGVCAGVMLMGLLLAITSLPARPRPEENAPT